MRPAPTKVTQTRALTGIKADYAMLNFNNCDDVVENAKHVLLQKLTEQLRARQGFREEQKRWVRPQACLAKLFQQELA